MRLKNENQPFDSLKKSKGCEQKRVASYPERYGISGFRDNF